MNGVVGVVVATSEEIPDPERFKLRDGLLAMLRDIYVGDGAHDTV